MTKFSPPLPLESFSTFGDLLKYLRRRARLTQRELSIAVKYSEAQISRLEQNQRPPDLAALMALFVPALYLEEEPEIIKRLMELAAQARGEPFPSSGRISLSRSFQREITETIRVVEDEEPGNLPFSLTRFIGREREIAEIKNLLGLSSQGLRTNRLITLTGSGGSGKTRLALEVARQLAQSYRDGVWFIELASITNPNYLPQAIISALGLPESRKGTLDIWLQKHLRGKQTLLILDNCEQIVSGVVQLTEQILRACPYVQILATSREILNIPGEIRFRVPSLTVSNDSDCESVKLFIDRAWTILPALELTKDNVLQIAQICRRLDGIPLAIELAAARMTALSVQQITARLENSFQILSGGSKTMARHQTLKAAIEWSYNLLSEIECTLLQRLSVFSGGWTLEAAESVASDSSLISVESVLDLLSQLVNKSLVLVKLSSDVETRYVMLQTIQEFAHEKLRATGEVKVIRARHFKYFLDFAGRAMVIGPQKSIWLNRLEAEQDNFRASLAWALESGSVEYVDQATCLMGLLADYAFYRGYVMEALEWFNKLLAHDLPPTRGRALGFQKAGFLTRVHGDFDTAVKFLEQSLTISRVIGDKERAGFALLDLGNAARDMGKTEEVIPDFFKALSLFQQLGDARGMLISYYQLTSFWCERHRELND